MKTKTRGVVPEARVQHLDGDSSIDQEMSCAIDSAHPASTQTLVEPVLAIKDAADQRLSGRGAHDLAGHC